MDLKVTSRSLGRVFAAMGFLLASLGVTAPAGAVSLVFQYGNSLKTHAHYEAIKERVELLARAYNNGFAGDTIIPIVLENCTGGCYGQSVTNRSARPYQGAQERTCGTGLAEPWLGPTPAARIPWLTRPQEISRRFSQRDVALWAEQSHHSFALPYGNGRELS